MPTTFLTVNQNTAPAIQISLVRDGAPIDVTGATALLIIKNKKTKAIVNTGHQDCIIVDGTNGVISYVPGSGDFNHPSTDYLAEVRVTYPDSPVETIYDQLLISVRPRLAY